MTSKSPKQPEKDKQESFSRIVKAEVAALPVKKAEDKEKELDNQLRESRAKLESFGVTIENLKID